MKIEQHVWKTADGRLVQDGDPDAAFLEYPAGMELADDLARKVGLLVDEPKPAKKAAAKPADKSASKPNDK